MVSKRELTYSEIENIVDMKYIDASTTRYTLEPGIYEFSDNKLLIESLLPSDMKVNINIDDIRLRSNMTTIKTVRFSKKSPFTQYYDLLNLIQEFQVILKFSFNWFQTHIKATNLLILQV